MMVAVSTAIPAINQSLRPRPVMNSFGDVGRQTSRDLNIRNESKTDAPLMAGTGQKRTFSVAGNWKADERELCYSAAIAA